MQREHCVHMCTRQAIDTFSIHPWTEQHQPESLELAFAMASPKKTAVVAEATLLRDPTHKVTYLPMSASTVVQAVALSQVPIQVNPNTTAQSSTSCAMHTQLKCWEAQSCSSNHVQNPRTSAIDGDRTSLVHRTSLPHGPPSGRTQWHPTQAAELC
jgi:hypothetical protein